MPDTKEMRAVYCEALLEEMKQDARIVVLEADLMGASGTKLVQDACPDRLINVGVAEANMVSTAAGMSACGKIPVCDTFAAFLSRRDYDQIFISVAYAGLNVKLVGTDPGVSAEHNGGTHMPFEDVGILRGIPTMTILEPADTVQLKKALPVILHSYGPVYMRLYRKCPHRLYDDDYQFELGKADQLRDGRDLSIIASGMMVWNALQAAEILETEGIHARVLNMHTIKPIDVEAISRAARETGAIVTAENHSILNGLGSAVAETLCENDLFVPLQRVGVRDLFGDVGTADYLMERFGLSVSAITKAARDTAARKR